MNKVINQFLSIGSNKESTADIHIYGDISSYDWWDDAVTPQKILDTLKEIGDVTNIDIHLNSYGGSVDAGNSIIAILSQYRKKHGCNINAYIEGIAASMASGIAMVADKIYQYDNALMMIHKPSAGAWGNADELKKIEEMLDKYEETLVNNYMKHFKGTEDELRQLLAEETWLTAQEALDYGLCDEILAPIEIAASAKGLMVNNYLFEKEDVVNKFKEKVKNIREENIAEMKYDVALNEALNISEEVFNAFNSPMDFAEHIKNSVLEPFKAFMDENGQPIEMPKEFISMDMAKEAIGKEAEDITAEEVLNLAVKGTKYVEPDPAAESKIKEYDKLFSALVNDAIANGIKAFGVDCFNEDTWNKTLKNMSYDDVANISTTWIEQAKIALNAGNRTSEPKVNVEVLKAKEQEKKTNYNV